MPVLLITIKNTTKPTAGHCPAVASNTNKMKKNNESKKGMKTLYWASTIETGIYAGEMVYYCLERNGKKAILELLKYYNFSEDIMNEYHFHLANPRTKDGKPLTTESTNCTTSSMGKEEMPITSTITNESILEEISEDALDYADSLDTEFSEWVANRSDDRDNVLYDPEDEMPDVYFPRTGSWANSYDNNYMMASNF